MKRLQDKRVWFGGGAAAALLVVAIAWLMFIGPERSSTSDLNTQAAAGREQNSALQATVSRLKQKNAHLARYTASLQAATAALPFDSGLPAFTRQLSTQAAANLVRVNGIVVGGVTAVAAVPTTPATPTTTGTTDEPVDPGTTPVPGVTPTSAAGGLFSVQVTITSNGLLADQLAFLDDIRSAGPRRALITSAQITPGVGAKAASIDGAAAFTTQLTIFSAPQSPAQVAALKKLLSGNIGN